MTEQRRLHRGQVVLRYAGALLGLAGIIAGAILTVFGVITIGAGWLALPMLVPGAILLIGGALLCRTSLCF